MKKEEAQCWEWTKPPQLKLQTTSHEHDDKAEYLIEGSSIFSDFFIPYPDRQWKEEYFSSDGRCSRSYVATPQIQQPAFFF